MDTASSTIQGRRSAKHRRGEGREVVGISRVEGPGGCRRAERPHDRHR